MKLCDQVSPSSIVLSITLQLCICLYSNVLACLCVVERCFLVILFFTCPIFYSQVISIVGIHVLHSAQAKTVYLFVYCSIVVFWTQHLEDFAHLIFLISSSLFSSCDNIKSQKLPTSFQLFKVSDHVFEKYKFQGSSMHNDYFFQLKILFTI